MEPWAASNNMTSLGQFNLRGAGAHFALSFREPPGTEACLVRGRVCHEVLSSQLTMIDYATSADAILSWVQANYQHSSGESLAPLHASHGLLCVGRIVAMRLDRFARAIDVIAEVTGRAAWQRVLSGHFSGFSMGKRNALPYTQDINGHRNVLRYTAAPREISLARRPAVPTAKFDLIWDGPAARFITPRERELAAIDFDRAPSINHTEVTNHDPNICPNCQG